MALLVIMVGAISNQLPRAVLGKSGKCGSGAQQWYTPSPNTIKKNRAAQGYSISGLLSIPLRPLTIVNADICYFIALLIFFVNLIL